jgi:hypothetical protein
MLVAHPSGLSFFVFIQLPTTIMLTIHNLVDDAVEDLKNCIANDECTTE